MLIDTSVPVKTRLELKKETERLVDGYRKQGIESITVDQAFRGLDEGDLLRAFSLLQRRTDLMLELFFDHEYSVYRYRMRFK